MNTPIETQGSAGGSLARLVVLPHVKDGTSGDENVDRLFAEAVDMALARAKPVIVEYLTQEVLKRMEVGE